MADEVVYKVYISNPLKKNSFTAKINLLQDLFLENHQVNADLNLPENQKFLINLYSSVGKERAKIGCFYSVITKDKDIVQIETEEKLIDFLTIHQQELKERLKVDVATKVFHARTHGVFLGITSAILIGLFVWLIVAIVILLGLSIINAVFPGLAIFAVLGSLVEGSVLTPIVFYLLLSLSLMLVSSLVFILPGIWFQTANKMTEARSSAEDLNRRVEKAFSVSDKEVIDTNNDIKSIKSTEENLIERRSIETVKLDQENLVATEDDVVTIFCGCCIFGYKNNIKKVIAEEASIEIRQRP